MILAETETIAVIGTSSSRNPKTGPMKQIWILPRQKHPLDAIKEGYDSTVCGDCELRRVNFNVCYVTPMALGAIYKTYTQGKYKPVDVLQWSQGPVRFGAYGDPAAIPKKTLQQSLLHAQRIGYTRQWRHRGDLKGLFMASVFSPNEADEAQKLGFKTFRIMQPHENATENEMMCPADGIIQCASCMICNGPLQNVAIHIHGSKSKIRNFDVLRKSLGEANHRDAASQPQPTRYKSLERLGCVSAPP